MHGKWWLGLLPFLYIHWVVFIARIDSYALKICSTMYVCIFYSHRQAECEKRISARFYSCSESFAYKFFILTILQMHTHSHLLAFRRIYIFSLSNNQTIVMDMNIGHAELTSKFSSPKFGIWNRTYTMVSHHTPKCISISI